jgi:hypothetical protein
MADVAPFLNLEQSLETDKHRLGTVAADGSHA